MGKRRRRRRNGLLSCGCILTVIGIIVVAAAPNFSDYNEWKNATKDECRFLSLQTYPCNKCSGTQGRTTCTSINKTVGVYEVKGDTCTDEVGGYARFYDACTPKVGNVEYPAEFDAIWTDTDYQTCWIKSCSASIKDINGNPGCKGDCDTDGWTFDIETFKPDPAEMAKFYGIGISLIIAGLLVCFGPFIFLRLLQRKIQENNGNNGQIQENKGTNTGYPGAQSRIQMQPQNSNNNSIQTQPMNNNNQYPVQRIQPVQNVSMGYPQQSQGQQWNTGTGTNNQYPGNIQSQPVQSVQPMYNMTTNNQQWVPQQMYNQQQNSQYRQ